MSEIKTTKSTTSLKSLEKLKAGILVKLYNRLSYYFCMTDQPELKITKTTTVAELQKLLDEIYNSKTKISGD